MDHLLYGAAYYDEYMPCERLEEDIRLMKKAGMNVVRIGESTWSTCEPQDGVFDFHHVTRVIEAMNRAGISVILGTPTYAVPTWLVRKYPDVLAVTHEGPGRYGWRQNMDITSPVYRLYAERVIRKMMEECAGLPGVIGVQLDNETKAYDTCGRNVQQAFVQYLKEEFHGDLDRLNAEFGLDYWSNRINAWEDFPDVRGTINASLGAEFAKFQRKLAADFLMWQRQIVEPYLREDQFITHNTDFSWKGYSYGLNGEVDVFEDAKAMTVVGTDIYHPSQNQLTGMEIAFGGDLTRSVKQDNYLVLETECQGFPNWLPFDGQLRLQAYSHLAGGADMVEYWHWHTLHNAIETYWKGVLSQDFKENDTYRACCQIGQEWKEIGSHLLHLKKKNRAAILVSNTALKALDWFCVDGTGPNPNGVHYNDVMMAIYDQLYRMNVECDFLFPQNAERMEEYDFVVIPALYAASEKLLGTIAEYVEQGGHILVTFKSGFADEHIKVWHDETPHTLARVTGVRYSHFTFPDEVGLQSSRFCSEGEKARWFMELLQPEEGTEGLDVLVRYDHPSWGKYAAVTRHAYGRGSATYLGCGVSEKLLAAILEDAVKEAGIPVPALRFPLIVRRGVNQEGREITYLLNYSGSPQTAAVPAGGQELLSGRQVAEGEMLTIPAWDLAIVEGA